MKGETRSDFQRDMDKYRYVRYRTYKDNAIIIKKAIGFLKQMGLLQSFQGILYPPYDYVFKYIIEHEASSYEDIFKLEW